MKRVRMRVNTLYRRNSLLVGCMFRHGTQIYSDNGTTRVAYIFSWRMKMRCKTALGIYVSKLRGTGLAFP